MPILEGPSSRRLLKPPSSKVPWSYKYLMDLSRVPSNPSRIHKHWKHLFNLLKTLNMKPSTLFSISSFLAVGFSQPVKQQPARFDVVVVGEGPLQYRALAQSSSFFYLGRGSGFTDSFCPPKTEKAGRCPPGKDTVLKDAHTLVKYPYLSCSNPIVCLLTLKTRTPLFLDR